MKKIRSTGMIDFRDTHKGRGFAVRGIDRQLFSHKRRAQGPRDAFDRAWRLLRDEASRLDSEMRQEWRSAARIS